jgi:hypothetical protein
VFVNIYAGRVRTPVEGVLRLAFQGRLYGTPFKIAALDGNQGMAPMTGPQWVRIDLRKTARPRLWPGGRGQAKVFVAAKTSRRPRRD